MLICVVMMAIHTETLHRKTKHCNEFRLKWNQVESGMFKLFVCVLGGWVGVLQALDALDRALQQEPMDPTVKAELHFSMGNQLREMNELDRAFEVL